MSPPITTTPKANVRLAYQRAGVPGGNGRLSDNVVDAIRDELGLDPLPGATSVTVRLPRDSQHWVVSEGCLYVRLPSQDSRDGRQGDRLPLPRRPNTAPPYAIRVGRLAAPAPPPPVPTCRALRCYYQCRSSRRRPVRTKRGRKKASRRGGGQGEARRKRGKTSSRPRLKARTAGSGSRLPAAAPMPSPPSGRRVAMT